MNMSGRRRKCDVSVEDGAEGSSSNKSSNSNTTSMDKSGNSSGNSTLEDIRIFDESYEDDDDDDDASTPVNEGVAASDDFQWLDTSHVAPIEIDVNSKTSRIKRKDRPSNPKTTQIEYRTQNQFGSNKKKKKKSSDQTPPYPNHYCPLSLLQQQQQHGQGCFHCHLFGPQPVTPQYFYPNQLLGNYSLPEHGNYSITERGNRRRAHSNLDRAGNVRHGILDHHHHGNHNQQPVSYYQDDQEGVCYQHQHHLHPHHQPPPQQYCFLNDESNFCAIQKALVTSPVVSRPSFLPLPPGNGTASKSDDDNAAVWRRRRKKTNNTTITNNSSNFSKAANKNRSLSYRNDGSSSSFEHVTSLVASSNQSKVLSFY